MGRSSSPLSPLSLGLVALATMSVAAMGGVGACNSDSGTPSGSGDTVHVDVEAGPNPVDTSDGDLAADSPFTPLESSDIYGTLYDAYALFSVCNPPKDAGASKTADGSAKDEPDAAAKGEPDAASRVDAGVYSTGGAYPAGDGGCQPFPAACDSEAEGNPCICLFTAFASSISCAYPRCAVLPNNGGYTFYCPP